MMPWTLLAIDRQSLVGPVKIATGVNYVLARRENSQLKAASHAT